MQIDEILEKLSRTRVLVVGDLMLDRYVRGNVERISPEAPVPVLRVGSEEESPGGAGNVALNLRSLGAAVELAGVTGKDTEAGVLAKLLKRSGVGTSGIVQDDTRHTTTKTRLTSGTHQIARVDRESAAPMSGNVEKDFLRAVAESMRKFKPDGIIISDYGKGAITEKSAREIITLARKKGIFVAVDPKGADYTKYRGAGAVTPNLREAEAATGIKVTDGKSLERTGGRLLDITEADIAVITMGSGGMSYFSKDGRSGLVPSLAREVYDVTGAGDTAVSVFTLVYLVTGDAAQSVEAANAAAGITVGKSGAARVSPGELLLHFGAEPDTGGRSKLRGRKELTRIISGLKAGGKRIVFTNGCFDLFHAGHVQLLSKARRLGDALVVAVNSDKSVARLKGKGRPFITESERATLLSALSCVDYVTVFTEDTPLELIKELRPDVLVKGGDYRPGDVVGKDVVEASGGEVRIIPLVKGVSTSSLAGKIKKNG